MFSVTRGLNIGLLTNPSIMMEPKDVWIAPKIFGMIPKVLASSSAGSEIESLLALKLSKDEMRSFARATSFLDKVTSSAIAGTAWA